MYTGQSYQIFLTGGWNANPNQDQVAPEDMIDVNNVNIQYGGRQPRGGSEVINATPITDSPKVTGVYQFIREDGEIIGYEVVDEGSDNIGDENDNILVSEGTDIVTGTSNGKIQQNYSTELKSGLENDTIFYFETYYNKLYITNGVDTPQVWGDAETYTWDMGTPKKCSGALAGAGAGNVDDGDHYYKVTFVTSSGESSGSLASDVVTVADKAVDGQVSLTDIEVGPEGTTSRKVYRTEAGGSSYLLLTTISDNTTTTYTDNTADSGLGAAIPTTNLAFLPADWDGNQPKYFVKHGRGVHKRLWAFGCETTPNILYVSKNGVADFSDDNVTTIQIMTNKITGLIEYAGNLIVFDRERGYIIDDTSLSVLDWGYYGAAWDGGCAQQRLLVAASNDMVSMDEDGNIFSIITSEKYGDYQIGSLTKPFYLNQWIKDNVDLQQIDKFHATYDSDTRTIKFFVVLNGESQPNAALVYNIDLAQWTKHTFAIDYLCSSLVRISQSDWKIFAGDDAGTVYSLEWDTLLDDDTGYTSNFTMPSLSLGNARINKRFDKTWIVNKPLGTETIDLNITIDNTDLTEQSVTMTGAKDNLENNCFPVGAAGYRIQPDISSDGSEDYFISSIIIDYTDLGA